MKRFLLIFTLAAIAMASCKKTSSTTTNTTDTTVKNSQFLINGITDITLTNDYNIYNGLNITVQYEDSAQESVSLSVSGLPPGIGMDSGWISTGIPTYTTALTIFDTAAVGVKPGSYPVTLTAATPSGKKRNYSFNVNILPMPSIFLGKYTNCTLPCGSSTAAYSDSLYADPVVRNKVWFTNFGNTGSNVYAMVGGDQAIPNFTIPSQTIAGNTFSGSGFLNLSGHIINILIHNGSGACPLRMR